ncbi:Cytochrome c oxidase subunit [Desmophyllum pertusum]|uniref:Cytochrome c oxidase subunit n=1 Tax=Desmophyllum pertusum TaxID=174260 RepID=A0A9W9Z7Y6_9CNID|nr:Cytochrome c oxidase subunit [Desmophyllum pertusum]
MASLLRMGALPRLYSRIACRQIQTSVARRYDPVPTVRPEYGSELAALQAKEQGPWTELTKQEKIDLYRAQFDKTIIEDKVQEPYMKKMIGLISILLAISVGLFSFLRKYVGPEKPISLTPEWQADHIKIAKQRRANPISGISSKS